MMVIIVFLDKQLDNIMEALHMYSLKKNVSLIIIWYLLNI